MAHTLILLDPSIYWTLVITQNSWSSIQKKKIWSQRLWNACTLTSQWRVGWLFSTRCLEFTTWIELLQKISRLFQEFLRRKQLWIRLCKSQTSIQLLKLFSLNGWPTTWELSIQPKLASWQTLTLTYKIQLYLRVLLKVTMERQLH